MPISMELPVFRSSSSLSRAHSCSFSSKFVLYSNFSRPRKFSGNKLKLNSKHFRQITMSSASNGYGDEEAKANSGEFWGDSEFVEVIGIGSRIDAVLDFCLDSPFQSQSLRFWNIVTKDSMKVQLQQRVLGKDFAPKIVEDPLQLKSCSKAIILVASAGYGLDHIAAIDILRTLRSTKGFSIAIILKPFSFEGQRRQDEVKDLFRKLQEHTNFCIDIDTDLLLKKDLVTLDEALKTAYNAVLLAINTISVLISEMHRKLIDVPHNNVKELKVSEITKILESHKEAKIGFGAGYNMKTSIIQAIYDCPFLGSGVKDLNGLVICILASSGVINNNDIDTLLHTFRQTTDHKREIIVSIIHEPNLEPNLLVTTVVIVGCTGQQASQKSSILSRLAQGLPFVFNLLRRHYLESNNSEGNNSLEDASHSKLIESPESDEKGDKIAIDDIADGFNRYSEEPQTVLTSNYDETNASRNYNTGSDQTKVGVIEDSTDFFDFYDQVTEGSPALQREPLVSWNLGSGHQIAQEWAKERAADSGGTLRPDNLSIFHLPVGVRSSEELGESVNVSYIVRNPEPKAEDDVKAQPLTRSSMSAWGEFTDVGFEAVKDFYNTASTLLKGKYADDSKKQGVLSVRAASMLDAERDSPRKWSPIMEMQYRGGIYKGRCQGGLPEGKGRLILGDGSIYDGTWRYGKRSGQGTFYFSNGDVFQGSWRDDVMHGKGWFYFHTGDRWFANFWKGKANGEGRFYSKSGDIFFGHFRDGWRHGSFLCINVNGIRYAEVWDEGVLVDRKQIESGSG